MFNHCRQDLAIPEGKLSPVTSLKRVSGTLNVDPTGHSNRHQFDVRYLNPWPPAFYACKQACKAGALPLSYGPLIEDCNFYLVILLFYFVICDIV